MPRGVLDVARGDRARARVATGDLARSIIAAFACATLAFAGGCALAHAEVARGHPVAFALFPTFGVAYLAACVPLAVAYTNPEDVRADLNACRPRDYAWLFRRTWGAFKDAEDGKVGGKDL